MQNTILYVLCFLIWGCTWFAMKFQLGVVDPLISISYRFFIAGLLIAAFTIIRSETKTFSFTRQQHAFIALQGFLLFFLNFWMFYIASQHLTSGLVAVCFATLPIMNGLNQRLFLKTPLRKRVMAGGALGILGIACVFWPELSHLHLQDPRVISLGLCLIATYIASLGNISALRNTRSGMPILATNAIGMIYGAAYSLAVALLSGNALAFDISFGYVISLAYLAVFGSAIAFICYLTLMSRIGADRAAYTAVLFPVVALLISTLFEDYAWSLLSAIGVALIIAGNVLALRKPKAAI